MNGKLKRIGNGNAVGKAIGVCLFHAINNEGMYNPMRCVVQ